MYGGNLPDIMNYVQHSNFKWCADETYVPVLNPYVWNEKPILKHWM